VIYLAGRVGDKIVLLPVPQCPKTLSRLRERVRQVIADVSKDCGFTFPVSAFISS
jgi:hypothetical protein